MVNVFEFEDEVDIGVELGVGSKADLKKVRWIDKEGRENAWINDAWATFVDSGGLEAAWKNMANHGFPDGRTEVVRGGIEEAPDA